MSLEVVELFPENDAELTVFLDALARRSPSVLAYHYPFYRDMLTKLGVGRPLYLGLRRSGQLLGYLPAFVKESDSGCVLSSLPFFGPNAGVLCHSEDQSIAHQSLLQDLLRRAEQMKALSCSIYTPFLRDQFELYDSVLRHAVVVEKFTQYLDLSHARWSKEIQYDLRKAKGASILVTSEITRERFLEFDEIYRQNCADYGIPSKPRECIEFLCSESVRGRFTQLYLAVMEGNVVAGLLVLLSPTTVSYYVPCLRASFRSQQPGSLLIDHAIQEAHSRGLRYWNWESSPGKDSGVYAFKKRWGAQETGYRVYVSTSQSEKAITDLGRNRITADFPYYFVWPFDRL